MTNLIEQAKRNSEEIIANRRYLHQCPEIGFDLVKTTKLVFDKLVEYGLNPQKVGKAGISCTIGKKGKVILLRGDMDALPMEEDNDLDFKASNGNGHTCGHDGHTAMLLGAAKLLKENEDKLEGIVKLMFQPAEEILAGATDMIENGILENPRVDAAIALHIDAGKKRAETGNIYIKDGPVSFSADAITINITGKDAHGSTPHLGVDANIIAAHLIIALQNIIDKESNAREYGVVLVGKMSGGTAVNSVASEARLEVTVRSETAAGREFLKNRVKEVALGIASLFKGQAEVIYEYGVPPLINDKELCDNLRKNLGELLGQNKVYSETDFSGSEDFCVISQLVPSALIIIGVGGVSEGYSHGLHHPSINLNEEALSIGSACYAYSAIKWLEDNK